HRALAGHAAQTPRRRVRFDIEAREALEVRNSSRGAELMAREHNFLLGQGERLVSKVQVPKAGGEKNVPYDLSTAKTRIAQRLAQVTAQISQLPEEIG